MILIGSMARLPPRQSDQINRASSRRPAHQSMDEQRRTLPTGRCHRSGGEKRSSSVRLATRGCSIRSSGSSGQRVTSTCGKEHRTTSLCAGTTTCSGARTACCAAISTSSGSRSTSCGNAAVYLTAGMGGDQSLLILLRRQMVLVVVLLLLVVTFFFLW